MFTKTAKPTLLYDDLATSLSSLNAETIRAYVRSNKTPPSTPRTLEPVSLSDAKLLNEIKTGDWSAVKSAIDLLGDRVTDLTDEKGNTVLHLVVKHQPFEIAQKVVDLLGKKTSALCKKVNLEGNIPLEDATLINNGDAANKMIKLLLQKTLDYSFKPLSELLSPQKIASQYPETLIHSRLKSNLDVACIAINQCRKRIHYSTTHPYFNFESDENKETVDQMITRTRCQFQGIYSSDEYIKKMEVQKAANCGEFGKLVLTHIINMKMERDMKVELFSIKNGDHCFVVIDRADDSKLDDFSTWGDDAVYADAWSGNAIPVKAAQFKKEMKAFLRIEYNQNIKYSFNIPVEFNHAYHELEVLALARFDMRMPFELNFSFQEEKSEEKPGVSSLRP